MVVRVDDPHDTLCDHVRMISTPEADFVASGSSRDVFRFAWHVDADGLRGVNAALDLDESERHARGFLAHWIASWLRLPTDQRPTLQILGSLPEDLAFLPGPGLVFATTPGADRWMCWYATDPLSQDEEAILDQQTGTLLFSVEGVPADVSRQFRASLRRLRFSRSVTRRGLNFYRRR